MSRASIISALQSIIANANATTGQSDATVTSATDRLIRGYGGGASNIIANVEVTGTGNGYLSFGCEEEPDAVIIYAKEWTPADTIPSPIGYCAVKDHFVVGVKYYNYIRSQIPAELSYQDIYYPWGKATGNGVMQGSYENGQFTAYSRGVSGDYWSDSYTFRCLAIKF